MYCLQLNSLAVALLLSCTFFPFDIEREHSLVFESQDFAVQQGQKYQGLPLEALDLTYFLFVLVAEYIQELHLSWQSMLLN